MSRQTKFRVATLTTFDLFGIYWAFARLPIVASIWRDKIGHLWIMANPIFGLWEP